MIFSEYSLPYSEYVTPLDVLFGIFEHRNQIFDHSPPHTRLWLATNTAGHSCHLCLLLASDTLCISTRFSNTRVHVHTHVSLTFLLFSLLSATEYLEIDIHKRSPDEHGDQLVSASAFGIKNRTRSSGAQQTTKPARRRKRKLHHRQQHDHSYHQQQRQQRQPSQQPQPPQQPLHIAGESLRKHTACTAKQLLALFFCSSLPFLHHHEAHLLHVCSLRRHLAILGTLCHVHLVLFCPTALSIVCTICYVFLECQMMMTSRR